jgi:hypothetical protein
LPTHSIATSQPTPSSVAARTASPTASRVGLSVTTSGSISRRRPRRVSLRSETKSRAAPAAFGREQRQGADRPGAGDEHARPAPPPPRSQAGTHPRVHRRMRRLGVTAH